MKASKTGLVSAGGVSKLFIARMPVLLRNIGPVKATSFRVARRIANSLRAGRPVGDYAGLNGCDLVWIAVPEAALDRILREFAAEGFLHGKTIVICGTTRGSLFYGALRAGGARVATLDAVPGDERTLIAEGHPAAMRELRRLAGAEKRKLIGIPAEGKTSYLASVHLASDLLLPYFGAAVELLRGAGFSRTEATGIAEGLAERALRSYAKAGRKAWSAATELDLRRSRDRDVEAIRQVDPVRAALYVNGIRQALDYFKN